MTRAFCDVNASRNVSIVHRSAAGVMEPFPQAQEGVVGVPLELLALERNIPPPPPGQGGLLG